MSASLITSFFTDEFWNRHMDTRVKGFPLMDDGFPWKLISLCLVYLVIIKFWRPKVSFSLKPWLLILNGTAFGCHGAGFFVCLLISSMGKDGLGCNLLKSNYSTRNFFDYDYVKGESIVRLATVLLFIRISLFLESLMLILIRDKPNSLARTLNELMIICMSYLGVKYLPGGPSLYFAQCYLVYYTYQYGYYTLKTGYQVSDSDLVLTSKKISILLRFAWSMAALYHPYYILSQPGCNNGLLKALLGLEFIYGLGLLVNAFNAIKSLPSTAMQPKVEKSQ